ncbi:Gfo/Idh/MocA family oxidoreductase [Metabacillus halosaccharovorans]|uniref:Gfo/Idh/MocA family protein n=1 Tax=Metabacillus halosaccharovorans TaxID=930124 RepID=UPI00204242B2|nr:Gfo/Idh/MocA family oxidoreductase [Metabacillus halosaccharovorans]MCM3441874.1 Gfo/Idh/MocA family oxidoreductase [Metabacillus halosaccharovorans]
MKFEKVRWGMIGCGNVTEVKSGPAFQKIKNSELVAVMRRTGELAEDYAKRHHVSKWYDDADALINDPNVDAVYIATPPGSHKEYTLKAAKAGKPVYVEKPMALNWAECNDMIVACKEARVPLYVAYYRRAQPRFIKIRELVESKIIGDIRFVSTTQYQKAREDVMNPENLPWRVQPELSGGGLFFDLASHTLDILDFLLGPIKEANGIASNQAGLYRAEDIVTGTYQFESGIHGIGSWCFSAFENVDVNEIIGSKGKITFSTFGDDPVILTTADGKKEWSFERPQHVHQPLLETIVDELTGGNRQCPSTGVTGARTNWVMGELVKGQKNK